ncbi:armadillo-type protein [Zopfochytrium polystomum]|nr:armadillo-type protein [Zopfochytrium polystomum]
MQDMQDELAVLRSDKHIKDQQIDELQRELNDLKSLLQKTIVTSLQSRSSSAPVVCSLYPPTAAQAPAGPAAKSAASAAAESWAKSFAAAAASSPAFLSDDRSASSALFDASFGSSPISDTAATLVAPAALPHSRALRSGAVLARLSSQAATAAAAAEGSLRSAEPPFSAASTASSLASTSSSVFDFPDTLFLPSSSSSLSSSSSAAAASSDPTPAHPSFRPYSAGPAAALDADFLRRSSSAASAPGGSVAPSVASGASAATAATAASAVGGLGTGGVPPSIVTGKSIWSIDDAPALSPFSGLLGLDSASPTDANLCDRPSNASPPIDPAYSHLRSMWGYEETSQDYGYETYTMNTMEPIAYTGYQYLVEKIVLANDQQASLNLQDVLKTGPLDAKTAVIEATYPHALSLIRNRFGNFLMQKCLEFGTKEQVRNLANIMIGHIYGLSCDRFGCHVVQKALDVCDDDVKVEIINELFRAIPETITHRFACHVWQRVFETKWSHQSGAANNRPRIAQRVEAALRSQWHLVANDENGSLVVQCIFENCAESEKAPIVHEVLAHTVDIAKGQWGNWVIQHLLEHGSSADKGHILKTVARHVHAMSIDQFASKVVEKGLKTCPKRDLYEIVDMVISPSRDHGRPSILDMMNNQYANYVVQHILTLSDPHQRDACARLIAPHLPILRGSKYGQRVAAIVEKHIRTSQQRFGTILGPSPPPQTQGSATSSAAMAAAFSAAAAASNGGGGGGGGTHQPPPSAAHASLLAASGAGLPFAVHAAGGASGGGGGGSGSGGGGPGAAGVAGAYLPVSVAPGSLVSPQPPSTSGMSLAGGNGSNGGAVPHAGGPPQIAKPPTPPATLGSSSSSSSHFASAAQLQHHHQQQQQQQLMHGQGAAHGSHGSLQFQHAAVVHPQLQQQQQQQLPGHSNHHHHLPFGHLHHHLAMQLGGATAKQAAATAARRRG